MLRYELQHSARTFLACSCFADFKRSLNCKLKYARRQKENLEHNSSITSGYLIGNDFQLMVIINSRINSKHELW